MRHVARRVFCLFAIVVLLSLSVPGCGPSLTDVSGQVTYNGKPLDKPNGTIAFLGTNGIPVTAAIDSEGNYHAVGVVVGANRVAVAYLRPAATTKSRSRVPNKPVEPQAMSAGSLFLTPVAYAVPETSNLTVMVEKNTVYNPKLEGPKIK